jgi:hypothetical protein
MLVRVGNKHSVKIHCGQSLNRLPDDTRRKCVRAADFQNMMESAKHF